MHLSLAISALMASMATSALAKPQQHNHIHVKKPYQLKRAFVDVYETAYEYVYETVYVGAPSPETAAAAASPSSTPVVVKHVVGDGGRHWSYTKFGAPTTPVATSDSAAAAATSSVEDPIISASSSFLDLTFALSSAPAATSSVEDPIIFASSSFLDVTFALSSAPEATSTAVAVALTSSESSAAVTSTTPAVEASAALTTTTASAGAVATTYQEIVLAHHNVHRRNHSSVDIVWSDEMAAIALAEASVCVYAHNVTGGGGGYGQNIAAGVAASRISEIITDLFYNGEVNYYAGMYGEANPDFTNFESWGHFSQIVWNDTTSVGCATVDCSASGLAGVGSDVSPIFTVCNYSPPGNMGGEYGANIFEPLGEPTVEWDYDL